MVQIEESWKQVLAPEFEKEYFQNIKQFILSEKAKGKTIYPPGSLIFNAFDRIPFDKLKVVILGQDPYHGAGQAHGLSFSVPLGVAPPPSLKNIYKELQTDIPNFQIPNNGNLEKWASQGIFLLNAFLTVNASEPASHQNAGWEHFTDAVIKMLSDKREHLVFLLWGNFAQKKAALIDEKKHLILKAAHPSPFSAHSGFFGCKHFSKTNAYLAQNGITPIDWSL
ncbi:MAG TPA: uracil-DNA glycosylase [Chitinophagales bacterium]